MIYNPKKAYAIALRKQGHTFKEIVDTVKIAKSTLNRWVKLELSDKEEKAIRKITFKKGKEKVVKLNKLRSIKIKKKEMFDQNYYSKQIKKISRRDLFFLGLGLYMAEGAKTGRWKSVFYNSDPLLNKIMMRFYRKICLVNEKRIHIQLLLHKNIPELKTKKYWSKILQLPLKQFNKASFIISKASKGKRPKLSLPCGTVQIAVGDKNIVNRIKGWTKGVQNSFS